MPEPITTSESILKRQVEKNPPANSDTRQALITQEWAAISQDVAQMLTDSMPGRTAEVLKHCKYDLHKRNAIVTMKFVCNCL